MWPVINQDVWIESTLAEMEKVLPEASSNLDSSLTKQPEGDLLKVLINSITDYAIFSLDRSGRIRTWNTGAQKLKGYAAENIIGKHFSCFYTEEDQAAGKPMHLLQRSVAEGRVEDEGWRVRKDGSKFWALVVITPMHDRDGRINGFAKVTRDITERKQAEEGRLRLAQLQEAARVRDEFLSYISHEMRTPLAALQLQLELMREVQSELSAERASKIVQRLDRAYRRLSQLIESVLELSRIQAGRIFPEARLIDVSNSVNEIVEEFRPRAERKGLRVIFISEVPTGTRVETDDNLLQTILSNLLDNAIKFTDSGTVEVGVSSSGAEYRIRVRDDGCGIAAEDCSRIFEPFERVEPVQNKHTTGFGLGLTTSKRLSDALGARLELQSKLGSGSSFTLVLPAEMSA